MNLILSIALALFGFSALFLFVRSWSKRLSDMRICRQDYRWISYQTRLSSGTKDRTAEEIGSHFQAFGCAGSGKILMPWGDGDKRTQDERDAMRARWDARCLSRSTAKPNAPAKAVRL